jgi:hypothetical protein
VEDKNITIRANEAIDRLVKRGFLLLGGILHQYMHARYLNIATNNDFRRQLLKKFLLDFVIMNMVVFALSFLASLYGRDLTETFVLALFFGSGFALILGGLFGFFFSSASFWGIVEFFRRSGAKEEKEKPKKTEKSKPKISSGQRFVILGTVLLIESLLLSFLL